MSSKLVAIQVTELGLPNSVLKQSDRSIPKPGPGEVQIQVKAAGLGLPDVLMCKGVYAYSPTLPFTPGQEVAGILTAVGEECDMQVGQRVMAVTAFYSGNGGFANYCLAPAHAVYPIADGMSDAEAAVFGIPYHTAYVGLKLRAEIQPGEVLLVHGAAGGTGSAAVQLGKALGATVIATVGDDSKTDYCRELGADVVINYKTQDFIAVAQKITSNRGVDVVYDPVGGELFERSLGCCASGGRLLAVGFACGRWGVLGTHDLVIKNCSLMGVFVGAYNREQLLAVQQALNGLYSSGRIAIHLSEILPFDELPNGLMRLERREVNGKIALQVG